MPTSFPFFSPYSVPPISPNRHNSTDLYDHLQAKGATVNEFIVECNLHQVQRDMYDALLQHGLFSCLFVVCVCFVCFFPFFFQTHTHDDDDDDDDDVQSPIRRG